MAYSNKAYFLKKIKAEKLASITEDTTDSTANLDAAIAEADSIINGFLANQITNLPLTENIPESIMLCSFQIAQFNLHTRSQSNDVPIHVKDSYDAAISFLKSVSRGEVVLFPAISEENKETSIEVSGNELVFNRGMW